MTGCVEQRSRMRLDIRRASRSDGRGQGRLKPARVARAPLTASRREGYLTHYSIRTPGDLTSLSDQVLSFTDSSSATSADSFWRSLSGTLWVIDCPPPSRAVTHIALRPPLSRVANPRIRLTVDWNRASGPMRAALTNQRQRGVAGRSRFVGHSPSNRLDGADGPSIPNNVGNRG